MNASKLFPKLATSIVLALFFGISLYIRVYFPYDQVFGSDVIKFTGVDAYYHMRVVDNLVHNFPRLIEFDPYFVYPTGSWMAMPPFFDWLLAGIIWVVTLGSPTQQVIDVVGVYFPAFLGALAVIPVYFAGRALFGHRAGLISAGLIAVLPGEFLGRSILGFTDHHIAETLLSATAMLFLVLAIKASREAGLTFSHLRRRDWATIARPIIYSLLSGIFLGIYLITWFGGPLFVFIISVFFVVQFVIDHLRRKSSDYLCSIGVIILLVSLIIYAPFSRGTFYLIFLSIAPLAPLVLWFISRQMTLRKIRLRYYPLSLLGLAAVGLGVFYAINPYWFGIMMGRFSIFAPGEVARTTMEMQPLLFPGGKFTTALGWGNFTTSFYLAPIALLILIVLAIKHDSAEKSLLVVWSLVILFAMLGQRRFAYYFVVNAALLSGYLSWQLFQLIMKNHPATRYLNIALHVTMIFYLVFVSKFNPILVTIIVALLTGYVLWQLLQLLMKYQVGFYPVFRYTNMALAVIFILLLVFHPNIKPGMAITQQARFAPSDAWVSSLTWLKENSPEPFGDASFYYEIYEPPPPDEGYDYPDSAYGVTAWWDYGYWIMRIAHRIPNSNPGGLGRVPTAQFFLSQNEDFARQSIQELKPAYLIIDYPTTITKFFAIATYAGMDKNQFYSLYYQQRENRLVPVTLFYPEYYRSLVVRLYNFDGKAVTPEGSTVISWEERMTQEGVSIKLITGVQTFSSYEEATAYVSSQKTGNHQVVGTNPFASPVPLGALEDYRLIHSSDDAVGLPGAGKTVAEVKIFEFIGERQR